MADSFYSRPFVITGPVSNNAFNFERRQMANAAVLQITRPAPPQIHVADLLTVDFDDLKKGEFSEIESGEKTVFEDYNDDGALVSCKGLKHFIKTKLPPDIPVYIFDNHNHAFYFWHLELIGGNVEAGATLVHVDQHKDTRKPESYLPSAEVKNESAGAARSLAEIFKYTNTVLNVGNFIPAAQESGLIGDLIFIDSEQSLKKFLKPGLKGMSRARLRDDSSFRPPEQRNAGLPRRGQQSLILDIDLDFFAPEMDYIENDEKLAAIRALMPLADVITIATSPFFIDQELAITWLKKILGDFNSAR